IRGDSRSTRTRRLDGLDERVDLVPVALPGHLQMIDFRGRTRGLRDIDGFVDSLEKPIALRADVRNVHPATTRGLAGERNQFRSPGIVVGGVDESGSYPEGTLLHRLANQRLHPIQLLRRRLQIRLTKEVFAHYAGADE